MKRILFGLVSTVLLTLAIPVHAAPITLKFSHVVDPNTPKGQMANEFKILVATNPKLKDKVVIEVFPNAELFGDSNVLEAMLRGDVQLAAPALSKFKKYTKKLEVFDLPFLFDDMKAVERFQSSNKGQELLKSLEPKGLVGLGYLHNGMKQLSASKPLKVPADAANNKFRIMSSDVLVAQFEAVNAVAIKKPFSEVYNLLETKAIDGQENTWSNIYSKKFFELQPYITESNHGVLDYLLVTSKDFWMGLEPEVRAELQIELDKAIKLGNKVAAKKIIDDRQAIASSGRSQIISLSAEQRMLWINAMRPVWQTFEDSIGVDLIRAALSSNRYRLNPKGITW